MTQRDASDRAAPSVQELRDRILQLTEGLPTQEKKYEYLTNYFAKWSAGRPRVNYNQFFAALQSLSLPLNSAADVFRTIDRDSNGTIDVRELLDVMFAGSSGKMVQTLKPNLPPVVPNSRPSLNGGGGGSKLGSAMRSAGSAMLGTGGGYEGRPPSGRHNVGAASARQVTPNGSARGLTPSQPTAPQPGSGRPSVRISSAASNRSARSGGASARNRSTASAGSVVKLNLADSLVAHFRHAVLDWCGAGGIHALGRRFKILDGDGNRSINLAELTNGLNDIGLHLEMKDLQLLLAAIDKENNGSLSFDEFIVAIRGTINQRREALIHAAFDALDANGNGNIQVDDVMQMYDAKHHPDVMSGRLEESQALDHFLSQFDGVVRDGCVTFKEFLEYYKSVSASIDNDDYFELMIRNAWHIAGGHGQYQNTANTRVLVKFGDGSQEVVTLEHDRGLDLRDANAVRAHLDAQGVLGAVSYSLAE